MIDSNAPLGHAPSDPRGFSLSDLHSEPPEPKDDVERIQRAQLCLKHALTDSANGDDVGMISWMRQAERMLAGRRKG